VGVWPKTSAMPSFWATPLELGMPVNGKRRDRKNSVYLYGPHGTSGRNGCTIKRR